MRGYAKQKVKRIEPILANVDSCESTPRKCRANGASRGLQRCRANERLTDLLAFLLVIGIRSEDGRRRCSEHPCSQFLLACVGGH